MLTESRRTAFSMCFLGVVLALMVFLLPRHRPMITYGIQIKRPLTTEPSFLVSQATDLRVAMGFTWPQDPSRGAWWIGREKFSREDFFLRLATERPSVSRRAIVTADARLQFGEVVAAVEALGKAGFEKAFLVAEGPRSVHDEYIVLDILAARGRRGVVEAEVSPGSIFSIRPHNFALQPPGAPGSD